MTYTKDIFANELLLKLSEEPFNIVKISRWCYIKYVDHIREMDDELYNLVSELSTMEDDPQFEYSREELVSIATKMLSVESVYRLIQKAFLTDWDPIGIGEWKDAQDEYDSYIPEVYQLLSTGSKDEVFMYLWWAETQHMELKGNEKNTKAFVQRLIDLTYSHFYFPKKS